jgi:hypothetical protein
LATFAFAYPLLGEKAKSKGSKGGGLTEGSSMTYFFFLQIKVHRTSSPFSKYPPSGTRTVTPAFFR